LEKTEIPRYDAFVRTLCIATILSLSACGSAEATPQHQSPAVEAYAQSLHTQIEQTQRDLAELAATPPREADDPNQPEPVRKAARVAWETQQTALRAKIFCLRVRLETSTGQRLPPPNLG
jgi:hypothetical protein